MKTVLSIITLTIALLMGFQSPTNPEKKLYMCTCEEDPGQIPDDVVTTKVKYHYLVAAEGTPDCCTSPLDTDHVGYQEILENEVPDHPAVWGLEAHNRTQMTAEEARELGCAMENKIISYADVEKFPSAVEVLSIAGHEGLTEKGRGFRPRPPG